MAPYPVVLAQAALWFVGAFATSCVWRMVREWRRPVSEREHLEE
jgi:hypothetical protein